ncbi:hypothetical protein AC1031_014121 [Aphanomyces cochlioides]|nr:hypothetical protein AC1031_014121 [Aphanomyces cochlioides]
MSNSSLFSDSTLLPSLRAMAITVQNEILNLGVYLVQYGKRTDGNITLLKYNIFDPAYPTFHFAAWLFALDWVSANREVLLIEGETSAINVITTPWYEVASLVNPLEVPVNVAFYIRYACLYVTFIVICVAAIASIYLFVNKGYVEGANLFEINRVAGIVWIGRTFLFIRSIAAKCLLSTEVLSLQLLNNIWYFAAASDVLNETSADQAIRILKVFLAAGEVSWLGFVICDILMVLTAQYTPGYVVKCNMMVWGMAAILSWTIPATHTATMERTCSFIHVDFQLECKSGIVSIGSFSRFMTLVGICVGSIATCYLYKRLRHPSIPPTRQDSLFLSSSAKHVYTSIRWMDNDVYHLDTASAAINGLLSVRLANVFYVFDLKIWRIFVIEDPPEKRDRLERLGEHHLLKAIPLKN